jgi:CBS domain-containing membrane protein
MKQNEPISKIMSSDLKTVQVGQKLSEARKLLTDEAFNHVPVLDGKKLVGMLSTNALMRLTFDAGNADVRSMDAVLDHQFTIEGVMKKDLITVKPTETVRHAAELLVKGSHQTLSVIGDDNTLAGLVTSTDLIRYLLEQY